MSKEAIHGLYIGWGIAAIALAFAVTGKHPHGFYVLLRWVCFLSFAYSTFAAAKTTRPMWAWLFAIEAVLFNPLVQIHLKRETWQTLDWLAIASVIVAAVMFRKELKRRFVKRRV